MQDIDFLPQRYRDAHAQRTRKLWGVLVVLLYAGLLCTSGLLQKSSQARLTRELSAANEQRAQVVAHKARLAALHAELKQLDDQASLIAYLDHPWPRTQIVAAVVAPLCEGIALDELRIQRTETVQAPVRTRGAKDATKVDSRTPALRDLERLRETCDVGAVTVTLKGAADDVSRVHLYLGGIGEDPLFSRVDLMSLDGQDRQRLNNKGCRFTARLIVRPGYGQPHGPMPAAAITQVQPTQSKP